MSNLERIFNAYKKELVILETIKNGPVSDIFLCKYKKKKAVIRIDKTWSVQMKFDRSTEVCLLYTSPSPRDATLSRMPSSA